MRLIAEPLTAAAFAPFGDVLDTPAMPGRLYIEDAYRNLRPHARPSLSIARKLPDTLPLRSAVMERHAFSAQSFIPMEVGRWLVVVAPHAPTGGPDMPRARAFLAGPGQALTYAPDTWHHPLTVLDRPATFVLAMWRDGSADDEEFHTVPPFTIDPPGPARLA